jgi:phage N-6-adenine-methyltransferase
MTSSLTRHNGGVAMLSVEKARQMIAACRRVDEVAEIRNRALAMALYLRTQRAAKESILDCQEIAVHAERALGERTAGMEKAKPGRQPAMELIRDERINSKAEQLAEVGITADQASKFEQLAAIPEDEFEAAVADARNSGSVSRAAVRRAHVSNNSGNNEWYTPPEYLEAARVVMGGIDLDPATSEVANRAVGAARFFTEESNGLKQPWSGRVWMNPPYAQPLISQFCERVATAYESEEIEAAIVLVNNGTETRWGQRLLGVATAVCFPSGRIRFLDPEGNPVGAPLQGQMVAYLGDNPHGFAEVFGELGICLTAEGDR